MKAKELIEEWAQYLKNRPKDIFTTHKGNMSLQIGVDFDGKEAISNVVILNKSNGVMRWRLTYDEACDLYDCFKELF